MSAASSIAARSARTGLIAAVASRPLTLAFTILAVVTLLRAGGRVDSDVAWQLWIAGRIHAGANLYTDIIETNPPLWFWMAVPVDRVAALLHLRIEVVAIAAMSGLVALSLLATNRLVDHLAASRRSLFLSYAALVLAAMPWMHVGQREQIVLVGTLPYTALITRRRQQGHASPALAAAVGAGAALGFALKHYFLILPFMLELWLLARQQRRWRPARPEVLAILFIGVLYGAALLLFEPDYISRIVPLAVLAYGTFGNPSLGDMFGPFGAAGMLILGAVGFEAKRLPRSSAPLTDGLLVAAVGFGIVYFIQFKGWPYHALPLIGCSSLALAAMLVEVDIKPATLRVFAPALLLLPLALSAEEVLHPALPSADLLEAVDGLGPSDSVAFLATEPAIAWSVTLQGGYRYVSRYMGFWMIGAILRNENSPHPEAALTTLGRRIVSETVEDFGCAPPRRIIVARPRAGQDGFDILPFFLRDPRFAAVLAHYRVRSRSTFETYELASPLRRPAWPCRRGV